MAQDVTKLANARAKGNDAEIQLRQWAPLFEELQAEYYRALVEHESDDGTVDVSTVYEMKALNRLILRLKTMARRGKEASRKIEAAKDIGGDA